MRLLMMVNEREDEVTMDFEKRVFAMKRVARLTDRLNRLNMLMAIRAHSGHPNDIETRKGIVKDRRSTLTSLKRWEKKLGITK